MKYLFSLYFPPPFFNFNFQIGSLIICNFCCRTPEHSRGSSEEPMEQDDAKWSCCWVLMLWEYHSYYQQVVGQLVVEIGLLLEVWMLDTVSVEKWPMSMQGLCDLATLNEELNTPNYENVCFYFSGG